MFLTLTFIYITSLYIIESTVFTCTSTSCIYDTIKGGDTVICPNNIKNCEIYCINKDQCKMKNGIPLRIFSSANMTSINCLGDNSCLNIEINIGVPDTLNNEPLLSKYKISNFNGPHLGETIINCNNNAACKDSLIKINGDFIKKVTLNANGKDSFKHSEFYCNLLNTQKCDLNCNRGTACQDSVFGCANKNVCVCAGNNCPDVTRVCESDPCIIKPTKKETVVCTNKYQTCIIDCEYEKDACKYKNNEKSIIYSGSNYTYIKCGNENACHGTEFRLGIPKKHEIPKGFTMNDFIGSKQLIDIDCQSKSACKQAAFEVEGNITLVKLNANAYDAARHSYIEIDLINKQNFNIQCSDIGLNGCSQAVCYCGRDTLCQCNGGDCVNILKSTPKPSENPTPFPSNNPTPKPTLNPTTGQPTPSTLEPTPGPTNTPTPSPTPYPTNVPTLFTKSPTFSPSVSPTPSPTDIPTKYTNIPTIPTPNPTKAPTKEPTKIPTKRPTNNPTDIPTRGIGKGKGGKLRQQQMSVINQQEINNKQDNLSKTTEIYSIVGAFILAGILIFVYWCYYKVKKIRNNKKVKLIADELSYNTFSNENSKQIELIMK